jgi:hypothetical protein
MAKSIKNKWGVFLYFILILGFGIIITQLVYNIQGKIGWKEEAPIIEYPKETEQDTLKNTPDDSLWRDTEFMN